MSRTGQTHTQSHSQHNIDSMPHVFIEARPCWILVKSAFSLEKCFKLRNRKPFCPKGLHLHRLSPSLLRLSVLPSRKRPFSPRSPVSDFKLSICIDFKLRKPFWGWTMMSLRFHVTWCSDFLLAPGHLLPSMYFSAKVQARMSQHRYSPTHRNGCHFCVLCTFCQMFPPKLLLSAKSLKDLLLRTTAIQALNLGLSVIPTTQAVYSALTSSPFMALLLMQ